MVRRTPHRVKVRRSLEKMKLPLFRVSFSGGAALRRFPARQPRRGGRAGRCERLVQRNGYRDRLSETRAGTVEPRIPKLRKGRNPLILNVGASACKQLHSRYSGMDRCNTACSKRFRSVEID